MYVFAESTNAVVDNRNYLKTPGVPGLKSENLRGPQVLKYSYHWVQLEW